MNDNFDYCGSFGNGGGGEAPLMPLSAAFAPPAPCGLGGQTPPGGPLGVGCATGATMGGTMGDVRRGAPPHPRFRCYPPPSSPFPSAYAFLCENRHLVAVSIVLLVALFAFGMIQ